MRRIADLARMTILGAFYGTAIGIPIVYFLGEDGLAPSLLCVAAMSALTSWWYARKIVVPRVRMSAREIASESSGLLTLGLVFMASGFMWMGSAYLVRLVILRRLGVEPAGFFQAAWALGGLYTGLVFRAMAADFYPRLTAVAGDHDECNRLTNEQAEVVLLLACPGVLTTLAAAPLVIRVFYAASFAPAVGVLRWIALAMLLQVFSWSMGFIVMAQGRRQLFFWSEFLSNVTLLVLFWLGVVTFGLPGAGAAFCGMYLLYAVGMYAVVRRISGFRLSRANVQLVAIFAPMVAVAFAAPYVFSNTVALLVSGSMAAIASFYSLKSLLRLIPPERLPSPARRMLALAKRWAD